MPISRDVSRVPLRRSVSPRAMSVPAKPMNCPGAAARRTSIAGPRAVFSKFGVLDHDHSVGAARDHAAGRNRGGGAGPDFDLRCSSRKR